MRKDTGEPGSSPDARREETFSLNIADDQGDTLLSGEGEYYNLDFMSAYTAGVGGWHTIFNLNEQSGAYADATDFVFLVVDFPPTDLQTYMYGGNDHTFTTSATLYNTDVVVTPPIMTAALRWRNGRA
ncbi:hypothetical protein [Tropicimonas sp.]|uniref:hypothetical protein n=1 Tax=Tropicimonas sp. TaxID=2067044 RepID=UPI003A860878